MRICDPCSDLTLLLFMFDQGRCVPKYSSDSIASQKVKEKASGLPHMFDLSFKKCGRV
jgi:hypothetical protein